MQASKVVENPTNVAIREHTRASFLGLGKIAFANDNDLFRGPRLTRCEINARESTLHRRHEFIKAAGGNPSDYTAPLINLARFDPQHAIIVLVERKYVDEDKLVKNPYDNRELAALADVKWTNEDEDKRFPQSHATIANGNGRIDVIRNVLASKHLKELSKINDVSAGRKTATAKFRASMGDRKKELYAILRERTSWIVALYDLGTISARPCPEPDFV
jgi:hypothetical protein